MNSSAQKLATNWTGFTRNNRSAIHSLLDVLPLPRKAHQTGGGTMRKNRLIALPPSFRDDRVASVSASCRSQNEWTWTNNKLIRVIGRFVHIYVCLCTVYPIDDSVERVPWTVSSKRSEDFKKTAVLLENYNITMTSIFDNEKVERKLLLQ